MTAVTVGSQRLKITFIFQFCDTFYQTKTKKVRFIRIEKLFISILQNISADRPYRGLSRRLLAGYVKV
jgi:hypothetical protein